jgi:putative addiction module killer protein
MDYNQPLRKIFKSATFDAWLSKLRDRQAKARIAARIDRLAVGNPGDVKPVGSGVSEMRIDYGPGYRVYFTQRGPVVIVILCGGDKRTQDADIERAIEIAASWQGVNHGDEI